MGATQRLRVVEGANVPVRRIIVACGSGVATSNLVAEKLRDIFRERGLLHLEVRTVDVRSLEHECQNADLLISLAPNSRRDHELPIPVLSGIPLLTGIGMSSMVERIVAMVKGQSSESRGDADGVV
jgi:galactitol PTS system EIIB component